ncbi:hypothetical protein PSR62_13670 [Rhodopirellula sp. P2]|nr:hypothetical protein [Rhodopirellula sp. P2]WDQ14692.1 hypothetical protein PSR62_13670 [Rhodopirellula sp. P2]
MKLAIPAARSPAHRWILPLIFGVATMAVLSAQSPHGSVTDWATPSTVDPPPASGTLPAAETTLTSTKSETLALESPLPANTVVLDAMAMPIETGSIVSYTRQQVMQWAHQHSPEANMIDQESRSVACGVDCEDEAAVCQLRLIRSVLAEIALGRRADDAADAAKAYDRLVAAQLGKQIAQQGIKVQNRLIDLANEADRLGVPDGNVLQLQQAKLVWQDMEIQQSFATQKLRQELARRTGRPESEVAVAVTVDELQPAASVGSVDAGTSVGTALANRNDLKAVQQLCAGMRTCNLSSARQLIGALSPGAGLAIAAATGKGLFSCLSPDSNTSDLNCRRQQCSLLRESLAEVVRNETLQAVLDVRLANARLGLIDRQLQWAQERLEETQAAIELDQQPVGSDDLIRLELEKLRGDQLARQLDVSLAITEWKRVQGIVLR